MSKMQRMADGCAMEENGMVVGKQQRLCKGKKKSEMRWIGIPSRCGPRAWEAGCSLDRLELVLSVWWVSHSLEAREMSSVTK